MVRGKERNRVYGKNPDLRTGRECRSLMKKNVIDDDECTALVVNSGHYSSGSCEGIVYISGHQDGGHWATDPLCVLYQIPAEGFFCSSDQDGLFV